MPPMAPWSRRRRRHKGRPGTCRSQNSEALSTHVWLGSSTGSQSRVRLSRPPWPASATRSAGGRVAARPALRARAFRALERVDDGRGFAAADRLVGAAAGAGAGAAAGSAGGDHRGHHRLARLGHSGPALTTPWPVGRAGPACRGGRRPRWRRRWRSRKSNPDG